MPAKSKCPCNCGQAPAKTTRLRKASCPDCGYIIRLSRDCISRGLPSCPCGGTLSPDCLHDACAAPGEVGRAAYAELMGREADSAVRSDIARGRVIRPMRCAGTAERTCGMFVPFGTNHDPLHITPCHKCGSTAPATFGAARAIVADPIPF